ncbi:uncharacterized protein DS421_20g694870 [Arachis hypogaea]|nr:uncharacterized protein DS421_20g694870 [Arachis hypogaea]
MGVREKNLNRELRGSGARMMPLAQTNPRVRVSHTCAPSTRTRDLAIGVKGVWTESYAGLGLEVC